MIPHLAVHQSVLTMQISAMSARLQNRARLFVLTSTYFAHMCTFSEGKDNTLHYFISHFSLWMIAQFMFYIRTKS